MAEVKTGYKTTEFWLAAVATLLGVVLASGALTEGTVWAQVVGVGATLLTSLGYTVSRTKAKAAITPPAE